MNYFSSYADKKPAILIMGQDTIPSGMTIEYISGLFDKSEPIPYVGKRPILCLFSKEEYEMLKLISGLEEQNKYKQL